MTIKASNTRSFLHLGTTKTGSSFIQQKILARTKGASYFHKEADQLTQALREDAETADLGKPLDPGKKAILSHEVLHGRPPQKMAPLLHRTFGEATVLVVTRDPAEWAQSFYFQRIRNGEDREAAIWLAEEAEGLSRQLNFDLLHREYANTFGAENVYFLPYEMLRDAPIDFLTHLKAIAGLDFDPDEIEMTFVNRSASAKQMDNMRLANRFLNRLAGRDKELTKKITAFRHDTVKHLTNKAPDSRPNEPGAAQLFPAEMLAPLYANLGCLAHYEWYRPYAAAYRSPQDG